MERQIWWLNLERCVLLWDKPGASEHPKMPRFNSHQKLASCWIVVYTFTFCMYICFKQQIQVWSFCCCSEEWPLLLPILALKNGEPAGIGAPNGAMPNNLNYQKLVELFSDSPKLFVPSLDLILQTLYGPMKITHLPPFWGTWDKSGFSLELEHRECKNSTSLLMRVKKAGDKRFFEVVYRKSEDSSSSLHVGK